MKFKRIGVAALAAATALTLAACSSGTPAAAPEGGKTTLKVATRLGSFSAVC